MTAIILFICTFEESKCRLCAFHGMEN